MRNGRGEGKGGEWGRHERGGRRHGGAAVRRVQAGARVGVKREGGEGKGVGEGGRSGSGCGREARQVCVSHLPPPPPPPLPPPPPPPKMSGAPTHSPGAVKVAAGVTN